MTSFELTNSVFNITDENISFSITTTGDWSSRGSAETIYKLQKLLELRFENHIDLHVKEVEKREYQIKTGDKEYNLSDPDTVKNVIINELKSLEKNDFEDMVFRMELTNYEFEKTLDTNHIAASFIEYTLPPGIMEITDIDLMLKSLLPIEAKVKTTNDENRLRSTLTTNKTKKFSRKSFSTQYWVLLNPIQGH